jgi:excisionase family DNA binding protein
MTSPEKQTTQEARLPELLTVKEYAAWYRVTTRTVYQWVSDSAVPVVRVGPRRLIRIMRDDPQERD